MRQAVAIIENPVGLHARPAVLFVRKANSYSSSIMMERDGEVANAKSILSVLALDARCGARIQLEAEGLDEEEAITGLLDLIRSNFGEDLG